jgi:hypothetical protein
MTETERFRELSDRALAEIGHAISRIDPDAADVMSGEILRAGTIVC